MENGWIYIVAFFVIHWYGSLFFQTFFLHRYSAHAQFTMSKTWERIFFVMTWLFQGSNYLSARAYGMMHRMHHAYADTEKDVHSPKHSDNLFQMMWDTKKIYGDIYRKKVTIESKFTHNVPDWPAFDKVACSYVSRLAWGTLYTLFYFTFVPGNLWFLYLLLPVHFMMSPVHGAIINWFAHKYGYRNYEVEDTSTNLMKWDVFMMGEGLHNNHHPNAARANFAIKKWEFDPSWPIIWTMDKLNIIKLNNSKPASLDGDLAVA